EAPSQPPQGGLCRLSLGDDALQRDALRFLRPAAVARKGSSRDSGGEQVDGGIRSLLSQLALPAGGAEDRGSNPPPSGRAGALGGGLLAEAREVERGGRAAGNAVGAILGSGLRREGSVSPARCLPEAEGLRACAGRSAPDHHQVSEHAGGGEGAADVGLLVRSGSKPLLFAAGLAVLGATAALVGPRLLDLVGRPEGAPGGGLPPDGT